jgi:hypothetical protein
MSFLGTSGFAWLIKKTKTWELWEPRELCAGYAGDEEAALQENRKQKLHPTTLQKVQNCSFIHSEPKAPHNSHSSHNSHAIYAFSNFRIHFHIQSTLPLD